MLLSCFKSFLVKDVDHVGHKAGIQAAYLYHDQSYIDKDVYEGNTDIPRRNAGMPSNARTSIALTWRVCQNDESSRLYIG
jgi:hypothetical protein